MMKKVGGDSGQRAFDFGDRAVGFGGRKVSAGYMQTAHQPFMYAWNPPLRDQKHDVAQGYVKAAARTIDMLHNSGWISGAIEKAIASMIGTGLRLAAKPNLQTLGWTADEGQKWSRNVEARFEEVAEHPHLCDAAGVQNLGQLTKSSLHSYFSHGETLALLPFISSNPYVPPGVRLKVLPAHKLTQKSNGVDMFQGVRMSAWGFPVAYELELRQFAEFDSEEPVMVPAYTGYRKQVVHSFDGIAGQVRGITPLASSLKVVKQFDTLADNTLQAALLNAIFAATIKSNAPTADVLKALQDDDEQGVGSGDMVDLLAARATFYEATKIDFGRGGKIAHLFPGEELNFNTTNSPNDNYEPFSRMLLREIAAGLGMTYEGVTGDYTGATYSSVRMSISENWPIILFRRKNIAAKTPHAFYCAWLAQEIEAERIPFPDGINGFRAKYEAATKADWRGPPKPQADDLKTQVAYQGYRAMGVMTDEQICAELGQDWEDVYEQRAREMKMREKLGLPEGNVDDAALAAQQAELIKQGDQQKGGANDG